MLYTIIRSILSLFTDKLDRTTKTACNNDVVYGDTVYIKRNDIVETLMVRGSHSALYVNERVINIPTKSCFISKEEATNHKYNFIEIWSHEEESAELVLTDEELAETKGVRQDLEYLKSISKKIQ